MDSKSHLTLVDPSNISDHDLEFVPLPSFSWAERPWSLPLDQDECATALHLAHGEVGDAAELLRVAPVRLHRMLRQSVRLQRVRDESLALALYRAERVPIRTLFDPDADHRRLEWASTALLKSKLGSSSPLSPAPPGPSQSATLSIANANKTLTFRWRTRDDPPQDDGNDALPAPTDPIAG